MMFRVKNMLGTLLFECEDGKYVTCATRPTTGLVNVNGGNMHDLTQLGGDYHRRNLSVLESTSAVMRALDLEHDEDVWCQIHEHIGVYRDGKVKEFNRRISEL